MWQSLGWIKGFSFFEHWSYLKLPALPSFSPFLARFFKIYLIWAYSRVSNKTNDFVPKLVTQYSLSALHSSSPHSNLKKKNNYVLNCSTFYHYWLKDEPCYGISVRLPFIVISSKFLEKLRKLLVSGFLVLIKILDWNTVASKCFSFKPLSKLMFVVINFLFLQKT